MTDPITLALRVAATLDQHNISYALGGSLTDLSHTAASIGLNGLLAAALKDAESSN